MRRLLIGLGSLAFILVAIILVVPLFLPKEEIKRQVVEEVDSRLGWRVRLDGPVSLSLFPGFSLVAENVGLAGEAGADGIEFAKAERIAFGLAWSGLISGNVQVTGIALDEPDIYLEIGPDGATSWEPRRNLEGDTPTSGEEVTTPRSVETAAPKTPVEQDGRSEVSSGGYLKSIGVDSLTITGGTLTYKDQAGGQSFKVGNLDLALRAPDLGGDVDLTASFTFQEKPISITGALTDPLGLSTGEQAPVSLTVSSGENAVTISGEAGIEPLRADLVLEGGGPSLMALAALAGQDLAVDPGAYQLDAKVSGSEAAVSIADLQLVLGELSLGGAADANLSGLVPEVSGRLVLKDGSIADLLRLAGQDLPASGKLSADLAFETVGMTGEELVAGLDLNGSVSIAEGEIGGLGLASAVGGDPEADRLTDLAMDVDLQGLENPISLSGALAWRGEAFSVTGRADTAKLLAGHAAPVLVTVKGRRVGAGFDGTASISGALDGAVNVETADLRGLMAWMGQPIGAGNGLKTFKASGIFGMQGDTLTFEETRFTLDATSGEANGKVRLGGKPSVTARLALRELVLDPYLGGSSASGGGAAKSAGSSGGGQGGAKKQTASGWSSAPIDFSGLQAVDADFKLTTSEIRWDNIKIDESALSTTIKNGVLTATLEKLSLYGGSGSGTVTLNGASATPQVAAEVSLSKLNAYPLLRDAAGFEWIEGKAAIGLKVTSRGGSEQALVQGLNGTASYQFADGAIRGINIPQMVRGLSLETLLGWQEASSAKTDFSSLGATFQIENGIATTSDLSLVGPLVRMTGKGTTDMPQQSLAWRVEPKIVPTLEGQAPQPRRKGEDKKLAGLGVPIVIEGSWNDPRIYPDIKGILENPEAAYKQLQKSGGELISILQGKSDPSEALVDTANKAIEKATGGRTQIDVQKVIEGDVDDEEVLKAVEEGFGLPAGLLGNVFGNKKKKN
ncbi:AsmA family protein [Labrenzia sp. 011]|uniref:AsmA family protein n=1 Tax=Labrenzia sp. 011 TaxID=2171494 RepID=UPI000D51EDA1|nr:AsmA family protein [Labrenzia sp. 011]PVB61167.1 membrane assembly protein AsmA [Labrenzia sp. 011]